MRWLLSDGTSIHLGGKVEGSTSFARELRDELTRAVAGEEVLVQVWPIGFPGHRLDVNDPALLDRYIRDEAGRPCNKWMMVEVLEAPEVGPLQECPDYEFRKDVVY